MTITITSESAFHRAACPLGDQNCENVQVTLDFRCAKCSINCLKCLANQLQASYVRGCVEARQAIVNNFSCICVRDCEE